MTNFNGMRGMTGYITPEGVFYECEYFGHNEYAERLYYIALKENPSLKGKIEMLESKEAFLSRMGFIALGSKGEFFPQLSHVRFPDSNYRSKEKELPITSKQLDWLEKNFSMLDDSQQTHVARYACLYVGKDEELMDQVEARFEKLMIEK